MIEETVQVTELRVPAREVSQNPLLKSFAYRFGRGAPSEAYIYLLVYIHQHIYIYLGPPGPSFLRVALKLQSLWPNNRPRLVIQA